MAEEAKGTTTETTPAPGSDGALKTFTQAERDAFAQSEADRRVTEALNTAKAKWEREAQESAAKASGDKDAQLGILQAKLDEVSAAQVKAELTAQTAQLVNEHGLGALGDILNHIPIYEGRKAVAEALKTNVSVAVEAAVAARLKTPAPVTNTASIPAGSDPSKMSAEQYKQWKASQGL